MHDNCKQTIWLGGDEAEGLIVLTMILRLRSVQVFVINGLS